MNLFNKSTQLTLKEISLQTGLHKSTIYRCVNVLEKYGYLERDITSHSFRVGLNLIKLATTRIDALELLSESKTFLYRLQAKTNCSVHLCILEGYEVVYLTTIDSFAAVNNFNTISKKGLAYCSSMGKCLLSSLSGKTLNQLFEKYEFKKFTDNTITNLEDLKIELSKIRENEYAVQFAEHEEQTCSIAVPIYNYAGEMIASIGIGMHISRYSDELLNKTLPYLKDAAFNISRRLGFENEH